MKYSIVTMKDRQGNSVEGVGAVSQDGTLIVAATVRKGYVSEHKPGTMANLSFADVIVSTFKITKDAEDGEFVKGELGTTILHTPYFQKQWKDEAGELNPVMHSTIFDYAFLQNLPGKKDQDKKVSEIMKQFKHVSEMFGPEFDPLYTAAINKAHQHLEELDREGKVTRIGNSKFAAAASAATTMVTRTAEKRKAAHTTQTAAPQNAEEGSVTAEDALPD